MEMEDKAELLKWLQTEIDEIRENLRADGELQPRICRVPRELSDLQTSSYRPRAVRIGPLHMAEAGPQFEVMEVTKLKYMLRLFDRLQNQGLEQDCVAAMLENEEKARRHYAQFQLNPEIQRKGAAAVELNESVSKDWLEEMAAKPFELLRVSEDSLEEDMLVQASEVVELNESVSMDRLEEDGLKVGAAAVELNESVSKDRLDRAKSLEAPKKTHNAQGCTPEKGGFAKTMLIDGCFIIELVYSRYKRQSNDPILSDNFKFSAVKHDLLLLGNQIPFFVLQELFDRTLAKIDGEALPSLPSLIISFFKELIKAKTGKDKAVPEKKEDHHRVHHILHLLHQHHLPMPSTSNPFANTENSRNCDCILQICCAKGEQDQPIIEGGLKHSATDLHLAGVKFVAAKEEEDLFRLQFSTFSCLRLCRRSRFEIPPFSIDDSTETLLRNLIAMEQCFPHDLQNYFTSHAFLMDRLINTPEDVKLLESAGIIHNYLGSPEEVANIFNTICRNVNIHPFKFQELCVQLNHYCNSWWPRCLAKLKRDYFASPWSAISFIAAMILFLLTLLQTIYTMLSFY